MNIIFGTTKTTTGNRAYQKHYDTPVVTVEAHKGVGTSKRLLFNRSTEESLGLLEGSTERLIFGFGGNNQVFVFNTGDMDLTEGTVVYTLTKNRVSYEVSKEKGKSISSARLHDEITEFLGVDNSIDNEFKLVLNEEVTENQGVNVYELVSLAYEKEDEVICDETRDALEEDIEIPQSNLLRYDEMTGVIYTAE